MRVNSFAAMALLVIAIPVTAQKVDALAPDLGPEPEDPIGATKKLMLDEL